MLRGHLRGQDGEVLAVGVEADEGREEVLLNLRLDGLVGDDREEVPRQDPGLLGGPDDEAVVLGPRQGQAQSGYTEYSQLTYVPHTASFRGTIAVAEVIIRPFR